MPCNSITTATVELGKLDKELLDKAMADLGVSRYSYVNGVLSIFGNAKTTAEVKRAYSKQVVLSQAKKFNWQVKETGKFQWQVTKR